MRVAAGRYGQSDLRGVPGWHCSIVDCMGFRGGQRRELNRLYTIDEARDQLALWRRTQIGATHITQAASEAWAAALSVTQVWEQLCYV